MPCGMVPPVSIRRSGGYRHGGYRRAGFWRFSTPFTSCSTCSTTWLPESPASCSRADAGYDVFMNGKYRMPFYILLLACSAAAQTTPAERLAKWKPVEMPLTPVLSAQQRQMVDKLGHACRLLDEIF